MALPSWRSILVGNDMMSLSQYGLDNLSFRHALLLSRDAAADTN